MERQHLLEPTPSDDDSDDYSESEYGRFKLASSFELIAVKERLHTATQNATSLQQSLDAAMQDRCASACWHLRAPVTRFVHVVKAACTLHVCRLQVEEHARMASQRADQRICASEESCKKLTEQVTI